MTNQTLPHQEHPPYSTRQLIDLLLCFWQREQKSGVNRSDFRDRRLDEMRLELRRRETQGYDDPFGSPYPEVTW
jgi:hypothetical protein